MLSYTPKGHGALLAVVVRPPQNATTATAKMMMSHLFHILHLYLGSCTQISWYCHPQPISVRALGELQRKVHDCIPWKQLLSHHVDDAVPSPTPPLPPKFHVRVTSAKSRLLHTTAIRDHVLRGIYKSLGFPDDILPKDKAAPPTDNDNDLDKINLMVHLYQDKVQISINTNSNLGSPLHERQYRLETGKAPLREDIAYCMLYQAGIHPNFHCDQIQESLLQPSNKPQKSTVTITITVPTNPNPNTHVQVFDLFCGSGTIPIEAAAMLMGLPPGRLRDAPLKHTCFYNPQQWDRLVQNATTLSQSNAEHASTIRPDIFASDRDAGAIRTTIANAQRAGVSPYLQTMVCAFTKHSIWKHRNTSSSRPPQDQEQGDRGMTQKIFLVSNLPFGRRISKIKQTPQNYSKHPLLPIYQSLGNRIKDMIGVRSDAVCNNVGKPPIEVNFMILTNDRDLARYGGFYKPLTTKLATTHGGISVCGMFMSTIDSDRRNDNANEGTSDPTNDNTSPPHVDVTNREVDDHSQIETTSMDATYDRVAHQRTDLLSIETIIV